jgi:outer membrane protein
MSRHSKHRQQDARKQRPFVSRALVFLPLFLVLAGCASVDPDESAPPTASEQYVPPATSGYQQALAATTPGQVSSVSGPGGSPISEPPLDLTKTYHLPDLVDLAERTNPETRVAWEQTRQAAIAVGIHEALYYPIIVLLAKGGRDYLNPKVNSPADVTEPIISADQGGGGLFLSWLLFDFGAREQDVDSVKHELMAATMEFNATHQKIIMDVMRNYYALVETQGKLTVANSNLESSKAVADASNERVTHGTETSPDLLLAQERAIQAEYDLEQASADVDVALANLCEAIGIAPTTQLKIAGLEGPLPVHLEETVDTDTAEALVDRPDLIADMAKLKAKESQLREARDNLWPKIAFVGNANRNYATATAYPFPVTNANLTIDNYGVFLQAEWTLFDGFANQNAIRLADSARQQAESDLNEARVHAAGEVFEAYMKLKTSLQKLEVSRALVNASQKSYEASVDAYKNGLRTVLDTLAAQRDFRQAQETDISTRAEVYTNWQDLAFAMGKIQAPSR